MFDKIKKLFDKKDVAQDTANKKKKFGINGNTMFFIKMRHKTIVSWLFNSIEARYCSNASYSCVVISYDHNCKYTILTEYPNEVCEAILKAMGDVLARNKLVVFNEALVHYNQWKTVDYIPLDGKDFIVDVDAIADQVDKMAQIRQKHHD